MKLLKNSIAIALSLWSITGASYMLQNSSALASNWANQTLPEVFWLVLGIVQIIFGIALLLAVNEKLNPSIAFSQDQLNRVVFLIRGVQAPQHSRQRF